jgi:hypothetical protein
MENAELESLAGEAKAADAPTPEALAPGAAPVPAATSDDALAREWAELPAMVGSGLSFAIPEASQIWTDEACLKWGKAMVPIAKKYGWEPMKGLLWLKLLGATGALVGPTVLVVRARYQAAQHPPAEPKPDAPSPPTP